MPVANHALAYGVHDNTPVVVGQPVGQAPPGGPQPTVVQGVPYRVHPSQASAANMPWMAQLPDKRQANKIDAIQKGGQLSERYPLLPDERPLRDTCWIFPFLLVLVAGVGCCLRYISSDILQVDAGSVDYPTVAEIVGSGAVGGLASILAAMGYLQLAKAHPGCVVWTSLVFGPCFTMAVGIALISFGIATSTLGLTIIGALFVLLGAASLFCVFFCWKHLIPFMIKLVEVVATVITDNPMMVSVSLFGSFLGVTWSLVMGFAFYGLYREFYVPNVNAEDQQQSPGIGYFLYFVVCLVFIWGWLVASNLAHVTYCGVFGRWYCAKDEGERLRKSFYTALGPAFGSICLGSFIIAVVRALEYMLRAMRRDAAEDGNIVLCVILLIVECIVSCIGDMMEYFSEWAYVQVACRGCSFFDAVQITFSMISCANVVYILQDLLLDSVVSMGTMLCAAIGTIAGGGFGYSLGSAEKALAGLIVGLFAGIICGGTAVGVVSSGVKTILSLWAESPDQLARTNPDIHNEFDQRIRGKM